MNERDIRDVKYIYSVRVECNLTVLFEEESGGFIATIVEIPGAISQGKTKNEATKNVLDAMNELFFARRGLALEEIGKK